MTLDSRLRSALWTSMLAASVLFPAFARAQSDPVRPILECVEHLGGGAYRAHFGYLNENAVEVTIPVGSDNRFTPSPQDRGQPTLFSPGRTPYYPNAAFQVDFDGNPLVWTLDGRTSTASDNPVQRCAVCGDGVVEGGEECDDGGTVGGDGCSATCSEEPGYSCAGSPSTCDEVCGDGIVTSSETCDDGNTDDNDGCDSQCRAQAICPLAPAPDCRANARTKLIIREGKSPDKSRLVYSWKNGESTVPGAFGDPEIGVTAYSMCIWDTDAGVPELALKTAVPPQGNCDGDPCWIAHSAGLGYAYRDPLRQNDGVLRANLRAKSNRDDKGLVQVRGIGSDLPMPAGTLPLQADPEVVVQVHSSEGECWESRFGTAKRNDAKLYRATAR